MFGPKLGSEDLWVVVQRGWCVGIETENLRTGNLSGLGPKTPSPLFDTPLRVADEARGPRSPPTLSFLTGRHRNR